MFNVKGRARIGVNAVWNSFWWWVRAEYRSPEAGRSKVIQGSASCHRSRGAIPVAVFGGASGYVAASAINRNPANQPVSSTLPTDPNAPWAVRYENALSAME